MIEGEGGLANHPRQGGVSPCVRIDEQLGKWQGAVGDDGEWVDRKGISSAGKVTAEEELTNAKAKSTGPARSL